jgi:hypothetical protein
MHKLWTLLLLAVAAHAHAGTSFNGIALNGVALNGVALNGVSLNGVSLNGLSAAKVLRSDPLANGKGQAGPDRAIDDRLNLHGAIVSLGARALSR